MKTHVIVTNRKYYNDWAELHPDMLEGYLEAQMATRVYFPFWSTKVPKEILKKYECIGFHTGDERGGSPIQHLIRRGINESCIKMFRMTSRIDGGRLFSIRNIRLDGSLEEILLRMSETIMEMINAEEDSR